MEPLRALLPLHPSYDMEAVQEENLGWQGNGRGWRQVVEAGAAVPSPSHSFLHSSSGLYSPTQEAQHSKEMGRCWGYPCWELLSWLSNSPKWGTRGAGRSPPPPSVGRGGCLRSEREQMLGEPSLSPPQMRGSPKRGSHQIQTSPPQGSPARLSLALLHSFLLAFGIFISARAAYLPSRTWAGAGPVARHCLWGPAGCTQSLSWLSLFLLSAGGQRGERPQSLMSP
uniref:Uncharacterized protein n=1 Tax=Myotis myotis TaxID=51298 RepID=A0A7J7T6U2_MYOMY|nr:hypothetical protein mMyoMyo1_009225 [Myotis myotis]